MDSKQLEKVAHNPVIQDVLQRVREAGLHKVASQMYNLEQIDLKSVITKLGQDLVYHQLKHKKIAEGLRDLQRSEKF